MLLPDCMMIPFLMLVATEPDIDKRKNVRLLKLPPVTLTPVPVFDGPLPVMFRSITRRSLAPRPGAITPAILVEVINGKAPEP